jgi:hypothetical protein
MLCVSELLHCIPQAVIPSVILVEIRIRAETRNSEQPFYIMIIGLIKPVSKIKQRREIYEVQRCYDVSFAG